MLENRLHVTYSFFGAEYQVCDCCLLRAILSPREASARCVRQRRVLRDENRTPSVYCFLFNHRMLWSISPRLLDLRCKMQWNGAFPWFVADIARHWARYLSISLPFITKIRLFDRRLSCTTILSSTLLDYASVTPDLIYLALRSRPLIFNNLRQFESHLWLLPFGDRL